MTAKERANRLYTALETAYLKGGNVIREDEVAAWANEIETAVLVERGENILICDNLMRADARFAPGADAAAVAIAAKDLP